MIKSKKSIVALALAGFLLPGCIYEVGIPDKPTRGIDRRFVGTWRSQQEHGLDLEITEQDKKHYTVVMRIPAVAEPLEISAFHGKVGSTELIAIHAIRGPRPWSGRHAYFQYRTPDSDTLILSSLNADLISAGIKSQEELIRQITQAATNPDLFRQDIVPLKRLKQNQ